MLINTIELFYLYKVSQIKSLFYANRYSSKLFTYLIQKIPLNLLGLNL